MKLKCIIIIVLFSFISVNETIGKNKPFAQKTGITLPVQGFLNASDFGFSPDASGIENLKAMQQAVRHGGTIVVSRPGTYKIAGTVYIGSNTTLIFGNGIFLKKVDEQGKFTHVFLNRGALTKTYDQNITIDGLQIIVNGIKLQRFPAVSECENPHGSSGQLVDFVCNGLRVDRGFPAVARNVRPCLFEKFFRKLEVLRPV
jgi:hypothetical protein